jgi:predicted transcriptional regulator
VTQEDDLTQYQEIEPGVTVPVFDRLYKVSTVAEMLDISTWTLSKYRRQGDLAMVDTTVGLRIRHSDMVKFINVRHGKVQS